MLLNSNAKLKWTTKQGNKKFCDKQVYGYRADSDAWHGAGRQGMSGIAGGCSYIRHCGDNAWQRYFQKKGYLKCILSLEY